MSATRSTPATDPRRFLSALRCVFVAGVIAAPALALAQTTTHPSDLVLAETLFQQGKELMAAKLFDAACPKLAESYKLDPGTGTLLALALCHEGVGKIASAWVELTDVVAASTDRPDRTLLAREHLQVLEPQLSKLTVVVPASLAELPGLQVFRDGLPLERPAWGTAVPIDGGEHTLEARAPHRQSWRLALTIARKADRRLVQVPLLAMEQAPSAGVDGGADLSESPTGVDVTRQRWGGVVGSIGIVGLGVGTFFGVSAISKIHDAKSQCPTAPTCTNANAVSENATGHRDATIADVTLGAGLAAGAVGLVLILTARAPSPRAALQVTPSVERSGATLTIAHSF